MYTTDCISLLTFSSKEACVKNWYKCCTCKKYKFDKFYINIMRSYHEISYLYFFQHDKRFTFVIITCKRGCSSSESRCCKDVSLPKTIGEDKTHAPASKTINSCTSALVISLHIATVSLQSLNSNRQMSTWSLSHCLWL